MNKQLLIAALLAMGAVPHALAQGAPFGGEEDVAFAATLWQELARYNLQGRTQINTVPYEGQHPHGAVLETLEGRIRVGEVVGTVFVKRNYGGDGGKQGQCCQ